MSEILGMLGAKGLLGLQRWIWIAVVIAAILIVIQIADAWHQNSLDMAEDAGATKAVVAGQNQTLDQLKDANDAEQEIRNGDRSRVAYDECLRNNRNKPACERYNPEPGQ